MLNSLLAAFVPQRKHASHSYVYFTVGFFVHFLGVEEEIDDPTVHGHGAVFAVGEVVDGAEVFKRIVSGIDGIESVVLSEERENLIADLMEGLLVGFVPDDRNGGIEIIERMRGKALLARLSALTGGEGKGREYNANK
jgi:hypothetical protein